MFFTTPHIPHFTANRATSWFTCCSSKWLRMHSDAVRETPSGPGTARMRHDEKYGSTRFIPGCSGVSACAHPLVMAQYVSPSFQVRREKT